MKVGMLLKEEYTNLLCYVEKVASDHMLVRFQGTGFQYMIRNINYNLFVKVSE